MNSLELDALYCEEEEEERWELEARGEEAVQAQAEQHRAALFLESEDGRGSWSEGRDGEIVALFAKERRQKDETTHNSGLGSGDPCLGPARVEGVELILKVNAHHGFSALTAILAVNYFDRFFASTTPHFPSGLPSWLDQLAAITCLSLAAKVEETQVPLLLDLQWEEATYLFEAKTIQRMELLILSTLKWRMNPVTPISFLDHIMGRLGFKNNLHWEFLRRCECLLLSVAADPNSVRYLPSVVATATMMRVIEELVEPSGGVVEYQNQLLRVLNISKEAVCECYQAIIAEPCRGQKKRQRCNNVPGSPSGVIDACLLCDGTWPVGWWSTVVAEAVPEPLPKRIRARKQDVPLSSSLDRVFVGKMSD